MRFNNQHSAVGFHILRIGLAITFLWIGILILKQPEAWGGYLKPWAAKLLPIPLSQAMLGTAILDISVGFLLLINSFTWLVALIGALHLGVILVTSGITDITVRDIAILAAAVTVTIESLPESLFNRIPLWKKRGNGNK